MRHHSHTGLKTSGVLLLLGLTLPSVRLAADTYPRQPGIDAEHYVFRLTLLTDDSNEIQADATVRLRITRNGVPMPSSTSRRRRRMVKGMTVTRVTSDGQPVNFTHQANRLKLPLPAEFEGRRHHQLRRSRTTVPRPTGCGFSTTSTASARPSARTGFITRGQWLPTIDYIARTRRRPSSSSRRKPSTRWSQWHAGRARSICRKACAGRTGRRTSPCPRGSIRSASRISSCLQSGRSEGRDAVVLGVSAGRRQGLTALERDARGAFEFFSENIGPYAYQKLAHVEAAGMGGGTEHATNIFYGEKSVTAGSAPVVHETAHQWFGDAVTESDWNDVWLSEGFATYFTLLYTEHASGRDAFVDGLRRSRDSRAATRADTSEHAGGTRRLRRDPHRQVQTISSSTRRAAGRCTCCGTQIGTDAFWRGIRIYYQRAHERPRVDCRSAECDGAGVRAGPLVVLRAVADARGRAGDRQAAGATMQQRSRWS